MPHGENAEKAGRPGKEYWSRRYPIPLVPGRVAKWLTKRRERRLEREMLRRISRDGFNG